MSITINSAGPENCWRFVYNTTTKVVKQVFLSSGITKTKDGLWAGAIVAAEDPSIGQPAGTVSVSTGYAQAIAQIATMGMTYVPSSTKIAVKV